MTIDYKQKYFDLKDKEDEQLRYDVVELKKMVAKHNQQHESDMVGVNNKLGEIVRQTTATNGRVIDHGKRLTIIEKIIGRKINFNDPTLLKTARVALVSVATIIVVLVAGSRGLEALVKWIPGV